MFDVDELLLIQNAISGIKKFLPNENIALQDKLKNDEQVKKYSHFMFFPEFWQLLEDNTIPELTIKHETRGPVGLIRSEKKNFVIKPLENSLEHDIAKTADKLGIGPKQYTTLKGYITEELLEGESFSRLSEDKLTDKKMHSYGAQVADILNKLHSRDILYNECIMFNDFNKSHLIIDSSDVVKLFDFGASLNISNHPNYTRKEIYTYLRSLPGINMGLSANNSQEYINKIIDEFEPEMKSLSKEELLKRDIDFISEGVGFASYKYGQKALIPFIEGFREHYSI